MLPDEFADETEIEGTDMWEIRNAISMAPFETFLKANVGAFLGNDTDCKNNNIVYVTYVDVYHQSFSRNNKVKIINRILG